MTEGEFPRTGRNTVKRVARRGRYDRNTVYDILDRALIVHVGIGPFADGDDGQKAGPTVIPMFHARMGDDLVFHGATTSRLMGYLSAGNQVCVTATLVDGVVLARSLFHHSMNYRSVVAFGSGRPLAAATARMAALRALTDKLVPGRWDDARKPSPQELKATSIVAVRIESASAKIRAGGPIDDQADLELPVWAGVVPIETRYGAFQPDTSSGTVHAIPDYLLSLSGTP